MNPRDEPYKIRGSNYKKAFKFSPALQIQSFSLDGVSVFHLPTGVYPLQWPTIFFKVFPFSTKMKKRKKTVFRRFWWQASKYRLLYSYSFNTFVRHNINLKSKRMSINNLFAKRIQRLKFWNSWKLITDPYY